MQTARNTEQLMPHFLVTGVIAGITGGVLMMIFTMLSTATYLHLGFFTPMYAIAVPLIGEKPLMTSVKDGAFYLAFGPALLGLAVHLFWSALWGLIFGLLARRLHLSGGTAILSGLVYGVLVMLVMIFVVLPIFGTSNAFQLLGPFSLLLTAANALFYGMSLGLWPVLQPQFFAGPTRSQAV
jgi:hypothetical protein